MVILQNNKKENFIKCQNSNGKCFIFDPLPRDRKPFFKFLPDFRHWSDQIYHVWKSQLGDRLIILPSIYILDIYTQVLIITYDMILDLKPYLLSETFRRTPNSLAIYTWFQTERMVMLRICAFLVRKGTRKFSRGAIQFLIAK